MKKLLLLIIFAGVIFVFGYFYNHKKQVVNESNIPEIKDPAMQKTSSSIIPKEWVPLLPQVKVLIEIETETKYKTDQRRFEDVIKWISYADITGDAIPEIMVASPLPPAGGDCYYILQIKDNNPEFINLITDGTSPVTGCNIGSGVYSNSFYFDTKNKKVVSESAYLGGNEPKCTAEIFKWDNNDQALVPDPDKILQESTAKNYCKGFEYMFK